MNKALEIRWLQKIYWKNEVLKWIDLDIYKGDFFSLLWVNWAWKTTIIWIITDLVNKTNWTVKVYGHDMDKNLEKAKRQIWVVPQEFNLDFFGRVIDIIIAAAWYYGIPADEARKRGIEILEKLDLWDKIDSPIGSLSGWMKRRVMIARALVHRPKFLILDEPTAWVDINLRKSMWEYLKQLNEEGLTILLTTHYLEEVEALCNRIAVINKWEIIENLEKDELFNKIEDHKIILTLEEEIKDVPAELKAFSAEIINQNQVSVQISKNDTLNNLFGEISKTNLKVKNIENQTNELEELFTKLSR